jgi:glycosyltransferase involved in cell wall biosynthesis
MIVDICSIVYNEELLLPLWIESWLDVPFINNIYLVDAGSTDKTIEIAKRYDRVNVLVSRWKNSFARQRNIAIKRSKGNIKWILQPDIDEIPCGNMYGIHNMLEYSLEDHNEIIIPYVKFYDFDTLWAFKNNVPHYNKETEEITYAINKSTTTIFKKGHLKGYVNDLHEMPVYQQKRRPTILSQHLEEKISIDLLDSDFFIGHYDQAKHYAQSKINKTSLYYEMGRKRVRYRLISDAIYEGKRYDKKWAEEALRKEKNNDISMIEEMGRLQHKSFMLEHDLIDGNFFHLNNEYTQKFAEEIR